MPGPSSRISNRMAVSGLILVTGDRGRWPRRTASPGPQAVWRVMGYFDCGKDFNRPSARLANFS